MRFGSLPRRGSSWCTLGYRNEHYPEPYELHLKSPPPQIPTRSPRQQSASHDEITRLSLLTHPRTITQPLIMAATIITLVAYIRLRTRSQCSGMVGVGGMNEARLG